MEDNQTASDNDRISNRNHRNRNIVDMLRDDQASGSKKNWKAFRDKLRLKRAGKAWTSSVPIPASDIPIQTNNNRMMTRRGSARYSGDSDVGDVDGEATRQLGQMPERQRSIRLLPVETDPEEDDESNSPGGEQKPAAEGGGDQRMSLLTLLSTDGSNYIDDTEEHVEEHEEEQEDEEEEEEDVNGDCNICCRCTVKHKGEGIGPCGHTFCKNCTKELHVSRGNCPACNDFILEILDIF